ncbi:MAG: NTP transferase domain-containing protein [Firmicutes bacterium]|nr:NTP transferase domain-containing protein [Bacillota bacterium]
MVDAVILAGADNEGPLKDLDPARYEALIEINGKPMVGYVIDAIAGARGIGNIVVVGPGEALESAPGLIDEHIPAGRVRFANRGRSILENLDIGVRELGAGAQDRVFVATGDLPLLTSGAVEDFLERCEKLDSDICYSVVTKETNDARFSGIKRTYMKIADGVLTGGNVMVVRPAAIDKCRKLVDMAVVSRKKPWLMLSVLGVRCAVKFLFGTLRVRDIEERFHRLTGLKGSGVFTPYAEIAMDVDKPAHLEFARSVLGSVSAGGARAGSAGAGSAGSGGAAASSAGAGQRSGC